MGFVHKENEIPREIIEKRIGSGALRSTRKNSRIVFNTRAEAYLAEHLKVISRALLNSLSLYKLILALEEFHALEHLILYFLKGCFSLFIGDGIVGRGENCGVGKCLCYITRHGVYAGDSVNLVTKEFHTDGRILIGCGVYLYHVTADAEFITDEVHVIALIAYGHQAAHKFVTGHLLPRSHRDQKILILQGVTQRVNTGD